MFSDGYSVLALRVVFIIVIALQFSGPVFGSRDSENSKPDLVVGIVVEKMRYDYLTRLHDQFGGNGFRRLLSEGSAFSNTRYDYLVNQSSSGYATIFTGANPSAHGVISDHWYDRLRNDVRPAVYNEDVVAVGGSYTNGRRSPSGLISGTIGDELRLSSDMRSRVYTVSMSDAAAVLSGGFSANAAWWFDDVSGMWMSSSYYIDSLPSWVVDFNSAMLPATYLDRVWEPSKDISSYFRIDKTEVARGFSYELKRMRRRGDDFSLLRSTPWGNTFTKDFALNLIINEQLGKRNNTDMIVVGFSATALIDSQYGTFSNEVQDAYLRLDQDIAHLLDFLDENYGKSRVLVFLTADRSVSYPGTYNNSARIPGGIFSPGMAMSLLRSYLNVSYGQGDWISFYNAGMVYLNHIFIEDNKIPLNEIQDRTARFLNQFSGVAGTVTEDVLRSNYFSSGILSRIQSGYHPKRSGDVMLYLRQGWSERNVLDDQLTTISYDQHVPLIFYGWKTGNGIYRREVGVTDIAPTISLMLNIPIPPFATGRPIPELLP